MIAAAVLLIGAAVAAPPAPSTVPEGEPQPSNALEDPDFRVQSRQFGLERRVEMYQWRRDERGAYTLVWNAAPIDSAAFDAAHRNPATLPVRNRQWWVREVMLDGRPVPLDVVRQLGQWQTLHPNFSRLPAHLAERFQPEGEGLATADNPLAPRIGDVRVTWHEFVLPPLAGKVDLDGDAWRMSARAAAAPPSARPAVDIAAATRTPARRLRPWLIAVAVAALAGLWVVIRAITGGKS